IQQECDRMNAAATGFGRWTAPGGWHVTLAFLGYQDPALVPTIASALDTATASGAPFALRLSGIGCFRRGRQVQVVWAGLEDDPAGSLARLQGSVTEQLEAAKVDFDRRPFSPHLTLARARRDATVQQSELISAAIQSGTAGPPPTEAACSEVMLFHS